MTSMAVAQTHQAAQACSIRLQSIVLTDDRELHYHIHGYCTANAMSLSSHFADRTQQKLQKPLWWC